MTRYFQSGTRLLFLLGLIVLILVGMAVIGALVSPSVVIEQRTAQEKGFTVQARFDYEVETHENTTVWPAGTRLPAGAAMYFYKSKPTIHVMPDLDLSSNGHAYLKGSYEATVFLRGVTPTGVVAWTSELQKFPPATVDLALEGGKKAWKASKISLQADPLRQRFEAVAKELEYTNLEHRVDLVIGFKGEGANSGGPQQVAFSQTLSIRFDPVGFAFPPADKLVTGTGYDEKVVKDVQVQRSFADRLLDQWIPLLLSAVCTVLLLFLKARRQPLGPAALEQTPEHRKFRAWITRARVHADLESAIEVDTLEGLVELAVDMNKRVLFDRIQLGYFVVDDRNTYCYQPRQTGPRAARRDVVSSALEAPEPQAPEKRLEDLVPAVHAGDFVLDPWITEVQIKNMQDLVRMQSLTGRTLIRTEKGYHLIDGIVCFTYRMPEGVEGEAIE